MPFSRSEPPFFYQSDLPGVIERLASQEALVVYAGAGVSIDRTGLSWAGLVNSLLKPYMENYESDSDGRKRAAIMDTNTPLQAASIVCEKYAQHSGDEWRAEIVAQLRTLLYVTTTWQRGELISAIVRLAAAFFGLGRNVYIVTTNYDEFMQREAESLVQANSINLELTTSVVDHNLQDKVADVREHTRPYQVVHVHGHVPKSSSNGTQDIILSELDYIRSQPLSSLILTELFAKSSVLILGSSLTDQPLLEALAKTASHRQAAPVRRFRLAVTALQSLKLPDDTPRIIEAVQDSIRLRMKQFDTDVIFPDFYCQIPQLLTEVQVCMTRTDQRRPYSGESSPVRYGQRLEKWWSAWYRSRHKQGQLRRRQQDDHEYLEQQLQDIRGTLHIENEVLKLEIWIRWEPGRTSRHLRLWASSTGTSPDIATMRWAEIAADSSNASVQAFCLGRPEIYPTYADDTQSLTSDRWNTYLCVPIRIGDEGVELPVAVVSLASMKMKENSKINEGNGVALDGAVRKMLEIGRHIAAVEPSGRRPRR
jgi:hypothetical protein